jgi:hypothetical protein
VAHRITYRTGQSLSGLRNAFPDGLEVPVQLGGDPGVAGAGL